MKIVDEYIQIQNEPAGRWYSLNRAGLHAHLSNTEQAIEWKKLNPHCNYRVLRVTQEVVWTSEN